MKIYFHLSLEEFTNCYMVVNDDLKVKQALIVDPATTTPDIILQLEDMGYELTDVLITHNHFNHVAGLSTLLKIYSPKIYAAEYEICGHKTNVLNGNGKISAAGLDVYYYSVPGHTADSMVYKIGTALFTGDTLTSGIIGETSGAYLKNMLCSNIEKKIFSQIDEMVIMPGHGPPSTVGTEKQYNLDISEYYRRPPAKTS